MFYPITPCTKPRQTQRDKWKQRPCVMRYRAFADECRLRDVQVVNGSEIIFYLPMPKSWSKKKRESLKGKPHTKKPDIDNLMKALFDALYKDDSGIWNICGVTKVWSEVGAIEINNRLM